MEYIRTKRKHSELPVMGGTSDTIDKDNIEIRMSNLEITKKRKTESGVVYNTYTIPVREYLGETGQNIQSILYDENLERSSVEDYYRIKNALLFKQMFG